MNLKGIWLTTKYVVPHMIERRYGKIVMTSSRDGLRVEPNYAHYNASKAGVIAYAKSLAIELGPYEINVNAVCPGQMTDRSQTARSPSARTTTRTGTWSRARRAPPTRSSTSPPGARTCSRRVARSTFREVAEGVLWLASDRSHMVTGHALPVDRGWIAKRGG